MANPTGYGKIDGSSFQFSMDGVSTSKQMDRLIELTKKMAESQGIDTASAVNNAEKDKVEALNKQTEAIENSTEAEEAKEKASQILKDRFNSISKVTGILSGSFKDNSRELGGYTSGLAAGIGTLYGALSGYADQLQLGLQRGISGGIMDFAVAAKTGGVSLGAFSKALEESGGAFASLGDGATQGAKNFGGLIASVRQATASVGNMGLSNDQLAVFTAQQVRMSITQGFKGKAAQDVVIKNSRALGQELDTLANQTGKSVIEMSQAVFKLAQDPLVNSFVRDVKSGGAEVQKSLNSYAANFSALFGQAGDKLIKDTIAPALSGLPMIINDTGKNLALASQSTYNEIERLAQKAKAGEAMTDDDRRRLTSIIKQEMATRGDEIRRFSQLGGEVGSSAKMFLELADGVQTYNEATIARRKKEDQAAQEFNSAMNQFKANLQALAIPFLQIINGIDWTLFINVMSGVAGAVQWASKLFEGLGKALGVGPGGLIGLVLGLTAVYVVGKTALSIFNKSIGEATKAIMGMTSAALYAGMASKNKHISDASTSAMDILTTPGMNKLGPKARVALGLGGTLATAGLGYGSSALKESGNDAMGKIVGIGAGAVGGATLMSGYGGWKGALIGAVAGGIVAGFTQLMDKKDESASNLADIDEQAMSATDRQHQETLLQYRAMTRELGQLNENMNFGNILASRNVDVNESGNRQISMLALGASR